MTVHQITVERYAFPDLAITVACGKGTYIRSIARDLGQVLGTGGYIQTLERTRIGPFRIEDALPLDPTREQAVAHLLPLKAALAELATVTLPKAVATRLCQGQRIRPFVVPPSGGKGPPEGGTTNEIVVLDERGEPLAIAVWDAAERVLVPLKVLR